MNKVFLLGRVGKQPEIKQTKNGKNYATFSFATTSKYNNEEKTCWHNVKCFGKVADIVQSYVTKGKQLMIEGEINNGSYEKDGNKVYFSEIITFNIQLLGSTNHSSNSNSDSSVGNDRNNTNTTTQADNGFDSNDIPF